MITEIAVIILLKVMKLCIVSMKQEQIQTHQWVLAFMTILMLMLHLTKEVLLILNHIIKIHLHILFTGDL